MSGRLVTFLTDFGLGDVFVGVCHAVILRHAPDARIVDLSHGIPRHDVGAGALALAEAVRYTGPAIHLAVVDPGVGSSRRAVCVEAVDGSYLVGPDNGLLMDAAAVLGGVSRAWDISEHAFRLEPVSATFHGRDVFASAVGKLAAGVPPETLGDGVPPSSLVRPERCRASVEGGTVHAEALAVDGFGNVTLDAAMDDLLAVGAALWSVVHLVAGRAEHRVLVGRTYADVPRGSVVLHEDSTRRLAIAVNGGSAADRLQLRPGARVAVFSADE